jgi:DNA polymerase III sliding clamp (beta) subunit (PCNA family)
MNYIEIIPTYQRKKSIPKQLKDLELKPLNEQFSKLTMPIVSDDDLRPNMMGNFFDMESKKIVSTDAHKLTAINMPNETFNFIAQKYNKELNENPKGLIFHTLKQMQKEYNDLLKIGVNESTGLQLFDEYVEKRVIEDGKYPNYEAVIPKEFTNEIYVDFTKLWWYSKVLLDAKIIDDATKINSSNENEYQNKKIEYLKDSYVPFLSIAKQIIFTYTLDGEKQYIGFNARYICDVLKFAMEYKGKTFGKVGISGNSRAMLIELENGLNSINDSVGLIMPVMIKDFNVIGDIDTHDTYYMYYNLDTNEINSDGVNYPIDETIGYNVEKSKQVSNTSIAPKMQDVNYEKMETLKLIAELKELSEFENAKEKKITMLLISDLRELVEFM